MNRIETHLIPRWGGNANSDWYPKAKQNKLLDRIVDMPNPTLPELESWSSHLNRHIKNTGAPASNLRIITHSIACHTLINCIEKWPDGSLLNEVIMVAAWWTIDRKFWESINFKWEWLEPWLDYPRDFTKVRSRIKQWHIVIGTEDKLSPNYIDNAQRWLNVGVDSVKICSKRGHFNGKEELELFKLL